MWGSRSPSGNSDWVILQQFSLSLFLFLYYTQYFLIEIWQVTDSGIHQILGQEGKISVRITQLDGPVPNPYDDVLSTPNVSLSPWYLAIWKMSRSSRRGCIWYPDHPVVIPSQNANLMLHDPGDCIGLFLSVVSITTTSFCHTMPIFCQPLF